MQRIEVVQDVALPVERVYRFLAEHENLGPLLGATVSRVRDGATSRNGVGSVRAVKVGPLPALEETVTAVVPDELIEYRITRGGFPVKDHSGRVAVAPQGSGTRVRWEVALGSHLPGADRVIAALLGHNLRRGLRQVETRA